MGVAGYLRPRLEEWLDRVGVGLGRLRGLVPVDSDSAPMAE